jgi:hypothetical protein
MPVQPLQGADRNPAHATYPARPQEQWPEDRARVPFQPLHPPSVAADAHLVEDDRERLRGPDVGGPAELPDCSRICRALRSHLGTTCSSLREPALPQNTHGVVDFVIPATPQCTSWRRQQRSSPRRSRPRGPILPGSGTPLTCSPRQSGPADRRSERLCEPLVPPGRCPLYVRNHCRASTRSDAP